MGLFSKSPSDGASSGGNPPGKPDSPSPGRGAATTTAAKPGARHAPQASPAGKPAPPSAQGAHGKPPPAAPATNHAKARSEEPPPVVVTRTIEISAAPAPPAGGQPARTPDGTRTTEAAQPPAAQAPAPQAVPDAVPDPSSSSPSIAQTFERLLSTDDLEVGFASVELDWWTPPAGAAAGTSTAGDWQEVRSLFAQLAANHVRQVRDFMLDLRLGEATIDWIGICEPSLRSLRRAADKLELADLCTALDGFASALSGATADGTRTLSGERRGTLLAKYDELVTLMPQAFALDLDRSQREAVILQSLLLQVPGVKKVTLDKLYAAGLSTLEAMVLATPKDVAATTGIPEELATRIVARFRDYRDQVRASVPDATHAQERERIAQLTSRLRREHEEFEIAAQGWTPEADDKKRELRKARSQTLLDILVALARLGEVDRLKEIERLPFERKVTQLESFLAEASQKYAAHP
jgi:DNA repair protein RadA